MRKNSATSGQASMEYLLVIALTFAILVPTTYLFYNYSKESTQDIIDAQITKLGTSIIDASETIYYSGEGSKTTIELNMPEGVLNVLIIDGRELVFNVTTLYGASEVVFFSKVNLSTSGSNCRANVCWIPELQQQGFNKLKIEAVKKSASLNTI